MFLAVSGSVFMSERKQSERLSASATISVLFSFPCIVKCLQPFREGSESGLMTVDMFSFCEMQPL